MGKLRIQCADCDKFFRVELSCLVVPPHRHVHGVCAECRRKRGDGKVKRIITELDRGTAPKPTEKPTQVIGHISGLGASSQRMPVYAPKPKPVKPAIQRFNDCVHRYKKGELGCTCKKVCEKIAVGCKIVNCIAFEYYDEGKDCKHEVWTMSKCKHYKKDKTYKVKKEE